MEKDKLYTIRKYVKAKNVREALRREPKTPVHDLQLDDTWKDKNLADAIGFDMDVPEDEDDE